NPPGDWRSPTPIPFLTAAPGMEFQFAVFPRAKHDSDAMAAVSHWLEEALTEMGAGGKTAVGYGRMNRVPEEGGPWLKDLRRDAELAQKVRLEQQLLPRMAPLDRALEEIASQSKEPNIKRWVLWLKDLER